MDAARIDLNATATALGAPPKFGQSPFAIGQGNRFERRVKDKEYQLLVQVLREVGIELPDKLAKKRISGKGASPGQAALDARVAETIEVLTRIARGDPDAPNVIDHGVTILRIGGERVYLEQDALAFRHGDKLQICEIKGFPIVDGSAEPEKVGAAARQSAVYLASLQDTLGEIGADSDLVSYDVVLICTRNYGIQPTARTVNVARELRALRRQLRRKEAVGSLLEEIGGDALLEELAALPDDDVKGRGRLLLRHLPANFVPRCIADCDMARVCRAEAEENGAPGRWGDEVQNLIAGIGDVRIAADLAQGDTPPPGGEEVAAALARARKALVDCAAMRGGS